MDAAEDFFALVPFFSWDAPDLEVLAFLVLFVDTRLVTAIPPFLEMKALSLWDRTWSIFKTGLPTTLPQYPPLKKSIGGMGKMLSGAC